MAASYEARKFGVHSAMPSVTAKRKCPDLIVKPRFDAYKAISLEIRQVFAEYTPIIELLSLDEAYLDVTENLKGIVLATQIAKEIRATIRAETGLTASAGVSYNKFLAKLASDHRKPDGLFAITPEMGVHFSKLPSHKTHLTALRNGVEVGQIEIADRPQRSRRVTPGSVRRKAVEPRPVSVLQILRSSPTASRHLCAMLRRSAGLQYRNRGVPSACAAR
jgi:hypothetical protein